MHDQNIFDHPELQHDLERAHRVRIIDATIENCNGTSVLACNIPFAELQKAKRGTGQHKNFGFVLDIEFTHPNGGSYVLHSAWVSINTR